MSRFLQIGRMIFSVRNKILALFLLFIVIFVVFIFYYIVPTVKDKSIELKKASIKNSVDSIITMIERLDKDVRQGRISLYQAKNISRRMIHNSRYGDENNDYFWINNYKPVMIMHPYKPKLNGTDLSEFTDPNGVKLFVEMVNVVKEKGAGYVNYKWAYKNEKRVVQKISYVRGYERWGWIIGTGVYIEDINTSIRELVNRIFKFTIMLIIVFVILILILLSRIVGPLKRSVKVAKSIAAGDISKRINFKGLDEIGVLAQALDMMSEKLHDVVTNIVKNIEYLTNSSEELSKTAEDLSSTSSEQAANLEEITSTVEEISANIENNTQNAQNADLLARETSQEAVESGHSVNSTVDAMKKIVGKISQVEEISSQTNLLSLNAAIEASRAGDMGKSFTIVANQVKTLAEKSSLLSREITELSEESLEVANKAGMQISTIIPKINKTANNVQDITASSEQQSMAMSQLNDGMNQINMATQSNASSSEELAATSELLKEQASELQNIVSFFKI